MELGELAADLVSEGKLRSRARPARRRDAALEAEVTGQEAEAVARFLEKVLEIAETASKRAAP